MTKENITEFGSIIFETHCSNNCLFCGGVKTLSKGEKKRQEETALCSLDYFKLKKFQSVDISGGDPIEYEGLVSFVRKVRQGNFSTIQLSTHGMGLAENNLCQKLISAGINKFRIPLYGSNASIHDAVTRNPGSFDKTLAGIKEVIKSKVDLQISTLITKQNCLDLMELLHLIEKLKVDDFYIGTPCIANNDFSFYIPFKDLNKYLNKSYKYIVENDKAFHFLDIPFCVFGKTNFSIIRFAEPPSLGKRKVDRYEVISGVPFYRIQTKLPFCLKCKMNDVCPGFFKVDIDRFGPGKLKPLNYS
ncbi:MAG: radical SAM protein [Minisyncoccales bacterium]|jgi:MoaA/NifB/PqqE/SkfB family radical SAM enzyme